MTGRRRRGGPLWILPSARAAAKSIFAMQKCARHIAWIRDNPPGVPEGRWYAAIASAEPVIERAPPSARVYAGHV